MRSDAPLGLAVLLVPYDLRESVMLGDAGSNALGALLGFKSVDRIRGWGRWAAVAGVVALNVAGERRSLGELIERTRRFGRPRPPGEDLVPQPAVHACFPPAIALRAAVSSVAPVMTVTEAPCVLAALGARDREAGQHYRKGH